MHSSPESSPEQSPKPTNQSQQDVGKNSGQVTGEVSGGYANNFSGCNVNFVDSNGRVIDQKSWSAKPVFPVLLPYLPDRTDQEDILKQAVRRWQARSKRQPFICLIHGDEFQCHYEFFERLRKVALPPLLNLDCKKSAIKVHYLNTPIPEKIEQVSTRLTRNLGDAVEKNRDASVEKINKTFGIHPGPVVVHLHLLTENWDGLGLGLLHRILDFWQQWPELGCNQTLLVCISIKYELKHVTTERKPWWFRNPFSWLKQFLKCRKYQKLNREIIEQLESLSASEFREFNRFTGVILPRLDNINRTHVENWVFCSETRTFAGEALLGQLLIAARRMFEQEDTMPMETVAKDLSKLLTEVAVNGRQL